jgi:hypothetical protein
MTDAPSFRSALRTAAAGARTSFLVTAGVGLSLVILGVVLGVKAHKAYGSALMLPFFVAACLGSVAVATLRQQNGVKGFDAEGRRYLLAAFTWNVACLLSALAAEWVASCLGVLGREPNELLDSIGMVLTVGATLAIVSALPLQRSDA